MAEMLEHNPIGHTITDYIVRGEERDSNGRRVGYELALAIPPEGLFALEVLTKQAYARGEIQGVLDTLDDPASLLRDPPEGGYREPYVLNDDELTLEALEMFRGRVVEPDLAASLRYEQAA